MADSSPPVQNWPLYWFAELERSIEKADFEGAAEALRELRRLGVVVRYRPWNADRKPQQKGGRHGV